jgi:hypothetical protein
MRRRAILALALLGLAYGCGGRLVNVAPVPPAEYSEAGAVSGEACGLLALGFIPVNVNERAERAYERALEKAHATSLTDTALTESWVFTPIGPEVCTEVRGTALVRSASENPRPTPPRAEFRENRRSDASDVPPR